MRTLAVALAVLLSCAVPAGAQDRATDGERERIRAHLSRTEAFLRASTPAELSPELRAAREANLDRLHEYWVRGVFPRNLDFPGERVPYFLDDRGVACAVAHLVIESGHRALAERISATQNNAYLADIHDAELDAWIASSGLTAAEHARIQPSYVSCEQLVCVGMPEGSRCDGCFVRGGTCVGGTCTGGTPMDRACSPGATCDTGHPCLPGYCPGGTCMVGEWMDCLDADECTADICDPTTGGCLHVPACTATYCDVCDDGSDCTTEVCYAGSLGCVYQNVIDWSCVPRPIVDAGLPDAGPTDAPPTHATWRCGCAASGARSAPAWLAVALIAVGLGRRRP